MRNSIAKALFKSHPYSEYRKLVTDLLKIEKSTGNEQSKELTYCTLLNETRMNHIEEAFELSDKAIEILKSLKKEYIWLVIAESWSDDCAELLPVLHSIAAASEAKIDLKIVFRHENEELMQFFLTNKAKAIPKLIVIESATGDALAHWGPRPKGAADIFDAYQKNNKPFDEIFKQEMQSWYLHDKGKTTEGEIIDMMLDLDQ